MSDPDNPETGRGLSTALIGVVGGLMAATAFVVFTAAPTLNGVGTWVVLVLVILTEVLFTVSLYQGGRGMTEGPGEGTNNRYDLQVKFAAAGLVCILLLDLPALFLRQSSDDNVSAALVPLTSRLTSLESQVSSLEATTSAASSGPIASSSSSAQPSSQQAPSSAP